MKEEYLWNKTGSDPEIERLENALKAFRYQAVEPPALPAKPFSLKREKRRFSFRLAFATMAFAALAVVFTGVQLPIPNDKIEIAAMSSETAEPPILETTAAESSNAKLTDNSNFTASSIVRVGQRNNRRTVLRKTAIFFPANSYKVFRKNRRLPTTTSNPNEEIADNSKVKNPTIKLTKEESYAYNRLMLALTITSSKLKLVTDKIEGIEERDTVPKIQQ